MLWMTRRALSARPWVEDTLFSFEEGEGTFTRGAAVGSEVKL